MFDFSSFAPIIQFIVNFSNKGGKPVLGLPFLYFFLDLIVTNGLRVAFNHISFIRPRFKFGSDSRFGRDAFFNRVKGGRG